MCWGYAHGVSFSFARVTHNNNNSSSGGSSLDDENGMRKKSLVIVVNVGKRRAAE